MKAHHGITLGEGDSGGVVGEDGAGDDEGNSPRPLSLNDNIEYSH